MQAIDCDMKPNIHYHLGFGGKKDDNIADKEYKKDILLERECYFNSVIE